MQYKSDTKLQKYQIVNIKVKNKNILGIVIGEVTKPNFECKDILLSNLSFSENQVFLAEFIANYYCVNFGISYGIFTPKNQSKINSTRIIKTSPNELSIKQNQALNFINSHNKTLLFGDTGSGKTEIYIYAMLECIKNGKNVIFLMPEISLTPQMEKRLKNVFGDLVCIWHSKITKKNKANILDKLDSYKIIAGARSALFLPIENIGLIIVDEEHDDAYKSNSSPRYNARDCAIYLSHKKNIKLILGSATPSLNSYYNFKKNNDIFRLEGRYFNNNKKIIFNSSTEILTNILVQKISNILVKKKQAIIFVPLRGNFKILLCNSCGSGIKCKNCSINMSLHSKKNAIICHYCGFSEPFFTNKAQCKNCSKNNFKALKVGTQEIAKELKDIFKNIRIEVFDRDEVTTNSKLKKILNDFNKGNIDILVGTQMLSKGHDYHNVELVAILGIDNLLNSSDFRAYERSVSMLNQISGRCGRKNDGEVYIQTFNKDFFSRFLNNYEDFLNFELNNRLNFYPPFTKLALISSQNKDDNTAKSILQNAKKIVESYKSVEIVGLNRAPIEKLNGYWRYFMLLRSNNLKEMLQAIHLLKNKPVIIDMDPLHII